MKQDPFPENLFDLETPELGPGEAPIVFGMWLVPIGAAVIAGERIAELICQGIVLTISAPVEGILVEQCRHPGNRILPGEVLGRIQAEPTTDP
jgi:pyruvate/2-oxoglutarate dehydrogenase complex dihydrolipoamide acyltransferase (E2) component